MNRFQKESNIFYRRYKTMYSVPETFYVSWLAQKMLALIDKSRQENYQRTEVDKNRYAFARVVTHCNFVN